MTRRQPGSSTSSRRTARVPLAAGHRIRPALRHRHSRDRTPVSPNRYVKPSLVGADPGDSRADRVERGTPDGSASVRNFLGRRRSCMGASSADAGKRRRQAAFAGSRSQPRKGRGGRNARRVGAGRLASARREIVRAPRVRAACSAPITASIVVSGQTPGARSGTSRAREQLALARAELAEHLAEYEARERQVARLSSAGDRRVGAASVRRASSPVAHAVAG
jgi:hypothetical protein